MCPKSNNTPQQVVTPAGYSLDQQGAQYDWTMTDENGNKKPVPKKSNSSADTQTGAIQSSTGLNTKTASGGLNGM